MNRDPFTLAPVSSALAAVMTRAGWVHVVSVSGGKDSLATLLLALKRFGKHRVVAIFCDTGNEHQAVHAYLDYLQLALGIVIHRLRAEFTQQIAGKREFIARDARTKRKYKKVPVLRGGAPVLRMESNGLPVLIPVWSKNGDFDLVGDPRMRKAHGRRERWTNKAKRRALAVLHPTGNPFLDMCLWKGRFPSRKGQFCTEELKRNIAVAFQLELIEKGHVVISWQGVRRDESDTRKDAAQFEPVGGGLYIYRPLVEWAAMQVFAYCASHSIEPNPLYKQGMDRVGCMPCINVSKGELREIARRFPEHIDEKAEWERLVGLASKRGASSFIPAPSGRKKIDNSVAHARANDIYAVVKWSKTTRGGKQFSLLDGLDEPSTCSSSYGLCE